MQKSVENHVSRKRASRINQERLPLIESRKRVIDSVYNEFKARVVPATWAYHPANEVVQQLDCFATLINDQSNIPLNVELCREALTSLPGEVNALNEEKTAVLLSLLVCSSEEAEASVQQLNLATSVYTCTGRHCQGASNPFISWQYAVSHRCVRLEAWRDDAVSRIPDF